MALFRSLSPYGIASAVWSLIALASRTVFLGTASPGTIKSIQRGTITIAGGSASATATVTSVNTALARLAHLGATLSSSGNAAAGVRLTLTNATTITATRIGTSDDVVVSYELVEMYG